MKVSPFALQAVAAVALGCCFAQALPAQALPLPYLVPQGPPGDGAGFRLEQYQAMPTIGPHPPPSLVQEEAPHDPESNPDWFYVAYQWIPLPETHLWEPPLANPMQPRIGIFYTSLTNANTEQTVETAIGGTFNFWRIAPADRPEDGVQFDGFAVAYTRFAGFGTANATDYRFGFPVTFAKGPWEGKIGYEHTSSHLGDDFIAKSFENPPVRFKKGNIRDELVVALARRWGDRWRAYGEMGVNFNVHVPDDVNPNPFRFNFGVEWSPQFRTGIGGEPFAAVDLYWLGSQDFHTNLTVQVGWQWRTLPRGRSTRLVLEYYNGLSRYGQFFLDREEWIGFGWVLDF